MAIGRAPQPGTGKNLQDSDWLMGLAGGDNLNVQTAAAPVATQAGATLVGAPNALGVEATLINVNSSVAGGGIMLPQAIAGREISILNATGNTIGIYANINVNKATGVVDTIQGVGGGNPNPSNILTNATGYFFCPVNGVWGAK